MIRKYFRNVGILGVTEIILRLKGLILMPILTKHFGAVNYGVWAQVSVLVSMITPLLVLGTEAAVLRYLSGKEKEEILSGFTSVVIYYNLAGIIVALFLWIFSKTIATTIFSSSENASFVVLVGGVILAGLMTNACRTFYKITGKAGIYSIVNIVQSIYTAGIAVAVVVLKGTIYQVVLYGLIADLILAGILLAHIFITNGIKKPDLRILLKFFRYGLPLVPAGYAIWALNLSDRLFLSRYGTLEDIGVYSVVYGLGYMVLTLIFSPIWLMYPSAAAEAFNQGRLSDLSRLFKYSTRLALGLLVPMIAGITILCVSIVRIFSTEQFVRGAPLISLVSIAYLLLMLSAYFDISLGLVGKQVWSTINISIAAIINIGLNFYFVPRWGINGAAWSTLIGFITLFILSIITGARQVRLEFDWKFFLKVCLASLGMVLILLLFPQSLSKWYIFLEIFIGAVVYALVMLALRAVSPQEWSEILRDKRWGAIKSNIVVKAILGLRE